MSNHFLFHLFSPVALLILSVPLLVFVISSLSQGLWAFLSVFCSSWLQGHLSKRPIVQGQMPQVSKTPTLPSLFISLTLHDFYSDSHFNYCSFVVFLFFIFLTKCFSLISFTICLISPHLCLLPSPPPSCSWGYSFMWSVWFYTVSYMFCHVKELYQRMELHPQIPSALTTFQRLC